MNVTIKDIAAEAELSPATVSAYLNGARVRAENRDAIECAITKLGYIRNDYARALKTRRSRTVGVIIYDLSDAFAAGVSAAIEETLAQAGYGILICDCKNTGKTLTETVRFLISKMVDGLIVIMPDSTDGRCLDAAVRQNIPVVVVDRLMDRDDITQIVLNNREAAAGAVRMFLSGGHREIAIITGSREIYTHAERLAGFCEALAQAGRKPSAIVDGELTVEGGFRAAKTILTEAPQTTAVLVTSYLMTVGAVFGFGDRPIACAGFDNKAFSAAVRPDLAAVEQPKEEMGRLAAQRILAAAAGESYAPGVITLCAGMYSFEGT